MKFSHLNEIASLTIVGATGLVGQEFQDILEENKVRIPKINLVASKEDEELGIQAISQSVFKEVEVAFFSTPNEVTKQYVPIALESGCLVIDDSSLYRMNEEVPLIIPEINGSELRNFEGNLISTPNCAVTPVALALKPLLDKYGINRVVVSTYQSVSGAGKKGFEELSMQTANLLNGKAAEPQSFKHQIAFNCLPMIGDITSSGESEEETKFQSELRKILGDDSLQVSSSCVRVPTFCGHGATVNVELQNKFEHIEEVRELLESAPGLKVIDNPKNHLYPTLKEATGSDYTFVGRLRRDSTLPSAISFWVVTDNLRKGAALNSVQILETLYRYRRMS